MGKCPNELVNSKKVNRQSNNTRAAVVLYIVLNKEEIIFNCLFRGRLLGASTAPLEAPSTLQGLKIYSLWLVCAAFAVFVTVLGVFNSTHFSLLCHFIMVLYCIDFYLQEKNFFTYQVKGFSYTIGTVNTRFPSQSTNPGIYIVYFTPCLNFIAKKYYLNSNKNFKIITHYVFVNTKQMILLYVHVRNLDNHYEVLNIDITIVIISMHCNMVVPFVNIFCEFMKFLNIKVKVLTHDYKRGLKCNGYETTINFKDYKYLNE